MLSHRAAFDARRKWRTRSAAIKKRDRDKEQPVFTSYEFTVNECADDNMVNNVFDKVNSQGVVSGVEEGRNYTAFTIPWKV